MIGHEHELTVLLRCVERCKFQGDAIDLMALSDAVQGARQALNNEQHLERVSCRVHDIYQKEAHRQGDVRHPYKYSELSESTKEFDRVLARWILQNWAPKFNIAENLPEA